ncbi:MAG: hypothetical protein A2X67_02785 [Ignavibacteria bacterium GWA2_55_11]|nr:MAG: hypothetical protein A2X67_02785 [Ignavibacteria bacterium GWA2_55_11]
MLRTTDRAAMTRYLFPSVGLIFFLSCATKGPSGPDPSASDVQLDPPPQGQGVQLAIPPFSVPQGDEVQRNYFMTLPSDSDLYVTRVEFRYNEGSHHCNVFKSDSLTMPEGTFTETFITLDYTKWDMFTASQREAFTWQLPPGVAIYLKAHQQICIQTHYVNASTQETPTARGKVLLNLWSMPASEVTSVAGLLFASNTRIILPPGSIDTVRKFVVKIPWDINILTLTGHFHSRGRNFWAVRFTTGEEFYRNVSWDEPPIKVFPDMGYPLIRNEQIVYYSDYYNASADTVYMGPHVENQEHSNLFMVYWPGPANGKTIYDVDQGW